MEYSIEFDERTRDNGQAFEKCLFLIYPEEDVDIGVIHWLNERLTIVNNIEGYFKTYEVK